MKFFKIFIVLIFLILIQDHYVKACSCGKINSVKEEIITSAFVGIGKILEIEQFSSQNARIVNDSIKTFDLIKYDVLISETFKGQITTDTITVFSGLGYTDCGINLEKDQIYVIYGDMKYINSRSDYPEGNNIFWTNICKRTVLSNKKEISKIERQLKYK